MDEHTSHELAYKKGYEQGKQDAMKWIPVTERLPEEDVRVLVWVGENDCYFPVIDTDRLHKTRWVRWDGYITHWMQLPEAPTTCHMTSKQQPPKGE